MPKLTRDNFVSAIDDLMEQACRNLSRDGHVAPVLIGVNAKGEQVVALGVAPEHMESTMDEIGARVLGRGNRILPAPFRNHPERVREVLVDHRAVAAAMIDEAWFAADTTAMEVLARDMSVSEHPDRVEGVLVMGVWPREYVRRARFAPILRDTNGTPSAGEVQDLFAPLDPHAQEQVQAWLADLLPQPH